MNKEKELDSIYRSLIIEIDEWYYKNSGTTEENRSLVRKNFGRKIELASLVYSAIPRIEIDI